MGTKKTRGQLIAALRELQALVGQIEGTYNNDRVPDRADRIYLLTARAFNIAVEALSTDPPQRAPSAPTHWMDDRGYVVTDHWLRNDPRSTSDYRAAYNIPCVMRRGKVVPLGTPTPAHP